MQTGYPYIYQQCINTEFQANPTLSSPDLIRKDDLNSTGKFGLNGLEVCRHASMSSQEATKVENKLNSYLSHQSEGSRHFV